MRRPCGFTLLEMLVAIALMALVAGSLYGGLYAGFKAHRSTAAALYPVRGASLTMDLLRQDFDAALRPTGVLSGAFSGLSGTGVDTLSFYSCANVAGDRELASDVRRVDLAVETPPGETQPVLMRRITANLMAISNPVVREQVLCRHVRTFHLRYFDGSLWQDNWDSAAQGDILPLAVEVTLEFSRNGDSLDADQLYRMSRVYPLRCGRAVLDTTDGATETLN